MRQIRSLRQSKLESNGRTRGRRTREGCQARLRFGDHVGLVRIFRDHLLVVVLRFSLSQLLVGVAQLRERLGHECAVVGKLFQDVFVDLDRRRDVALPALLIQALTGVWLALQWVPDVGAWFAPASLHARLILVKLALLAATLALAAHARFRVLPRLDAATLPLLGYHVVGVTVLGVALLIVGVAIRTGGVW